MTSGDAALFDKNSYVRECVKGAKTPDLRGLRNHLLVYDAGCGPCARFKRSIEFLDLYDRIDYASLAQADREGLLRDLPARVRFRSFHLLSPGGETLSGAKAIPRLVSLLPAGRLVSRLMTSTPGGPGAIAFAYTVFSRLHDMGSCGNDSGVGSPA